MNIMKYHEMTWETNGNHMAYFHLIKWELGI